MVRGASMIRAIFLYSHLEIPTSSTMNIFLKYFKVHLPYLIDKNVQCHLLPTEPSLPSSVGDKMIATVLSDKMRSVLEIQVKALERRPPPQPLAERTVFVPKGFQLVAAHMGGYNR